MSLDTRGIDPQRLLPQSLEDRLLGWLARFGGACLLALIVMIWLSLVSWSYSDPSLTHATTVEARNTMGPLGAIVADLLLQMLGFSAVIALVAPAVWTVELLREGRVDGPRTKTGFIPSPFWQSQERCRLCQHRVPGLSTMVSAVCWAMAYSIS